MIRTILSGVNWGTDAIEEQDPQTGAVYQGRQINLLDPQSGQIYHIPFSGDSLKNLIAELAEGLTPDQRREIAPKFNGGVILPTDKDNNKVAKFPNMPKHGPQG